MQEKTLEEVKKNFELENEILDKILPTFKSATVWGHDGFQIQIINVLRQTIQETLSFISSREEKAREEGRKEGRVWSKGNKTLSMCKL